MTTIEQIKDEVAEDFFTAKWKELDLYQQGSCFDEVAKRYATACVKASRPTKEQIWEFSKIIVDKLKAAKDAPDLDTTDMQYLEGEWHDAIVSLQKVPITDNEPDNIVLL